MSEIEFVARLIRLVAMIFLLMSGIVSAIGVGVYFPKKIYDEEIGVFFGFLIAFGFLWFVILEIMATAMLAK